MVSKNKSKASQKKGRVKVGTLTLNMETVKGLSSKVKKGVRGGVVKKGGIAELRFLRETLRSVRRSSDQVPLFVRNRQLLKLGVTEDNTEKENCHGHQIQ